MAIQFTCPHCGVVTDVAEQYAGQTGPCARCGKTITVPGSNDGGSPFVAMDAPPKRGLGAGLDRSSSWSGRSLAVVVDVRRHIDGAVAAGRASGARGGKTNRLSRTISSKSRLAMHNYNQVVRLLPARVYRRQERQADAQLAGAVAALYGPTRPLRSVSLQRAVGQPQQPQDQPTWRWGYINVPASPHAKDPLPPTT